MSNDMEADLSASRSASPALLGLDGAPISKESLSRMAYDRIRAALMSSQLQPGQKLVLRSIATELQISPTPVREALLRLVSEHALQLDHRGIVEVPKFDLKAYAEIRDLRIELEGRATATAAVAASDTQLERLLQVHEAFLDAEDRGDAIGAVTANEHLHRSLYALANMPVLLSLIDNLWARCGPILARLYADGTPRTRDPNRHAMIFEGLRKRDATLARMGIEADIMAGWRVISEQYR